MENKTKNQEETMTKAEMKEKIEAEVRRSKKDLKISVVFAVIPVTLLGIVVTAVCFRDKADPIYIRIAFVLLSILLCLILGIGTKPFYRTWKMWSFLSKHPEHWSLVEDLFRLRQKQTDCSALLEEIRSTQKKLLEPLQRQETECSALLNEVRSGQTQLLEFLQKLEKRS